MRLQVGGLVACDLQLDRERVHVDSAHGMYDA